LSSVEDSSADSPPKGYSTEAWNPPKNWVSPERIALALISAQPRIALRDCVRTLHSCQSSQGLESFVLKRLRSAIFEQLRHDQQTVKVGMSIAGVWMQPSRGKSSGDTVGETLLNALKDLNRCRSLAGIH